MTKEEDMYLSRAELDPHPESFLRGIGWMRKKWPRGEVKEVDVYFKIQEIKDFARDEVARATVNGYRGSGRSQLVKFYTAGFMKALDLVKDSLVNNGIKLIDPTDKSSEGEK